MNSPPASRKPDDHCQVVAALQRMAARPPLGVLILEALRDWGGDGYDDPSIPIHNSLTAGEVTPT